MLIDETEVTLIGGHGGAGKVSFSPPPQKGPDGGNGGRGGNVYFRVTSDLTALKKFTTNRTLQAENGGNGGSNKKSGKDGQDLEILVPVGTQVTDLESGLEIELSKVDEKILISLGGLGGRGNFEFRSPTRTTPEFAQPGLEGIKRHLKLNLKLIADFGLIGLPNAGKSSLLNELTSTSVRVADYPFTTLEPNLGVVTLSHGNNKIMADIPGLIEGASLGKGLGIKFLKHIEKVQVLIHCLSLESEDLLKDYSTVRKELEDYKPEMKLKKEIIVLTKTDLYPKEEIKKKVAQLKKITSPKIEVSIHDWDSLEKLKDQLLNF